MQTNVLISVVAPVQHLHRLIALFGPANIIEVGANRRHGNKNEVVVIAVATTDFYENDVPVGLPADATIVAVTEANGTAKTPKLDARSYARIALVERRNGFAGMVADVNLAQSPALTEIIDQIMTRKIPAFDTAFAHQPGKKDAWIGKPGQGNMKIAFVDTRSINCLRFFLNGVILQVGDMLYKKGYPELQAWTKSWRNPIEGELPIFGLDGIRSLSHVSSDERLVVNTDQGGVTLDIEGLSIPGMYVKPIGCSDECLTSMSFVGAVGNDTVAYVDHDADDTVVAFVPHNEVPAGLVKAYKLTPATA